MPDAVPRPGPTPLPSDESSNLQLLFGGRLMDQLPAAVFVACPGESGPWLYASARIHGLLGYSAEELIAEPGLWASLLHPLDRSWVLAADSDPEGADGRALEYRMYRRDGQLIWVADDSTVGPYGEHRAVYHGLLQDITARKRSEMLLAAHADLSERIVAAEGLVETLGVLAELTEQISGAAKCLIELVERPRADAASALSKLVISPRTSRTAPADVQPVPPAFAAAFSVADGAYTGRVLLHYRPGAVVQVLDSELAAWSARLAGIIAARAAERSRLAETVALLGATLDSTADGIVVLDRQHRVVGHNRKFSEMWRLEPGTGYPVMLAAAAELLPSSDRHSLLAADELGQASQLDELVLADGRILERYQHIERGIAGGESIGRVWSFRDVTAQRTMERELRERALNDPLTPLANRTLFVDELAAALAEPRSAGSLAVLLLDLDDFKTINDGLGYAAGDKLLIAVADRLRGCLRQDDLAARLSGDEFLVMLRDLNDPREASYAAERILTAVSRPLTIDGQALTVRASIGIAVFEGSEGAAELLRNADLAMYTAKRGGGASCRSYVPGMHVDAVARMELKADLERAINAEQLAVYYQPVVDLGSGRILGVEALVRWHHPARGVISPIDFIPLAEQTGLIERLGRWVLRQACTDTADWRRTIPGQEDLSISVNLSPRQLSNLGFPDEVRRVLWASGLPATALILEITESTLVEPGVDAVLALNQLKHIGLRLALDDFGTGYSSLAQLVKYPLDVVKIDKSFVDHIDGDPANSALTMAVLNIANALSLSVTVEGIETPEQLALLFEMGARHGQGYLMARPMPSDQVRRLLEALNIVTVTEEDKPQQ